MPIPVHRDEPPKKDEPKPEKSQWPMVVFLLGLFLISAATCIAWKVTP